MAVWSPFCLLSLAKQRKGKCRQATPACEQQNYVNNISETKTLECNLYAKPIFRAKSKEPLLLQHGINKQTMNIVAILLISIGLSLLVLNIYDSIDIYERNLRKAADPFIYWRNSLFPLSAPASSCIFWREKTIKKRCPPSASTMMRKVSALAVTTL